MVLSTGLAFLVDRVKKELGITRAIANELLVEKGVLSGKIRINVQHDDRERQGHEGLHKGDWVRQILASRGIDKKEAAAVGDGEGDLAMFQAVGLSIGYHPSERIMAALDHALDNGSFREVLDIIRAYE